MNQVIPSPVFRVLAWAGCAAFLAVAFLDWRLENTYHTALALVLAALLMVIARKQRPTWLAALLLVGMLAFGIYRALTGYALLSSA
ncbi:hypothetical protein [Deinococcus sp. UYEF24]